jgi:cyclomaltodextrinase / maltogenic alpha-amylase / neopullulanase
MNYPMRTAILGLLTGCVPTTQFAQDVEALLELYPREHINAMYNLIGSHDTERVLTLLDGDVRKLRLAYLFLFAYPGVPSIYYGDEIGMEGGRDPDCRRAFPWDAAQWNTDLRDWVKQLAAARHASPALRRGDYQQLLVCDQPAGYAFARTLGDEGILICLNPNPEPTRLAIPVGSLGLLDDTLLSDLLGPQEAAQEAAQGAKVENGMLSVTLAPFSGAYFPIARRTAS